MEANFSSLEFDFSSITASICPKSISLITLSLIVSIAAALFSINVWSLVKFSFFSTSNLLIITSKFESFSRISSLFCEFSTFDEKSTNNSFKVSRYPLRLSAAEFLNASTESFTPSTFSNKALKFEDEEASNSSLRLTISSISVS